MIQIVILLLAIAMFFMYAPYFNQLNPVEYSVTLPISFTGPMSINNRLDEVIKLHEGEIHWPESMAVHKGKIYTGLGDGQIVSINDQAVNKIVRTGKECEGQHEEDICGRPLGMEFNKGQLYVADAYHGLFVVDVESGLKKQVLPSSKFVESKSLHFLNGLTVDEEQQVVYLTQSSTKWNISKVVVSILEHDTSGRLLKYDIRQQTITVLKDNLSFPNGVILTHDKKSILFSEMNKHKIFKYDIKGENTGILSELPLLLPGEPDNISRNVRGNYWVAVGNSRTASSPTLYDRFCSYPLVRKSFLIMYHMLISSVSTALKLTGSVKAKELAFEMVNLRAMTDLAAVPAVIVEFDETGKVIQSLHAPTGKISHISEVLEHDGHLYLGSWRNKYLGKVKL